MPHLLRWAVFALCALVWAGPARAQEAGGLVLSLPLEEAVVAEPGRPLTLPVGGGTGALRVEAPPNWRVLVPQGEGPAVRLVTLLVPADALAGRYPVRIASGGGGGMEVVVEVPTLRRIELVHTASERRFVVAGQAFPVAYLVSNRGNTPAEVVLAVSPSFGQATEVPRLRLAPGASEEVAFEVETPEGVPSRRRLYVEVRAVVAGEELAHTAVSVDVLPRLAEGDLEYHRYPMSVGLASQGAQFGGVAGAGVQFDASGSGTLTEDGLTRFDFALRGPGTLTLAPVTFQDAYAVRVVHPGYGLELGDHTFSSGSALTETFYGSGGEGTVRAGPVEAQAHYAQSRYGLDHEQAGGSATLRIGEAATVGVHGLWRRGLFSGETLSASAALRPHAAVRVEAEGGISGGAPGASRAGRVVAEVRTERVEVYADAEGYGLGYPSFNQGLRQASGTVRVRPGWGWTVEAGGSASERLRGLRTAHGALGFRDVAQVYARRVEQRAGIAELAGTEDAAGAVLTLGPRPLSVRAEGRLGWVRYPTFEARGVSRLARLRVSVPLGGGVAAFASATYSDGPTAYFPEPRTQRTAEAGLHLHRGRTLRGRLSAFASEHAQAATFGTRGASADVAYTLPNGHAVEVRAAYRTRYASTALPGPQDASFVSLGYRVPLNVRLRPSERTGLVRGQLLDRESGQGIAGVPVYLGTAGVVTDARGAFALPGQRPGPYELHVDAHDLGLDRVFERGGARALEVRGGEATFVELAAVRAGRVAGRVMERVGATVGQPERGDLTPFEGAVVELEGESGRVRRLTDPEGAFAFRGLLPGAYTVRVLAGLLPEGREVVENDRPIQLGPSGEEAVTFEVRPVRRAIQMVQAPVAAVRSPPTPARGQTHTVRPGEWLQRLARQYYGDARHWTVIWEANRQQLPDPDLLRPGQILTIPDLRP
jgi:hypothetical protein